MKTSMTKTLVTIAIAALGFTGFAQNAEPVAAADTADNSVQPALTVEVPAPQNGGG